MMNVPDGHQQSRMPARLVSAPALLPEKVPSRTGDSAPRRSLKPTKAASNIKTPGAVRVRFSRDILFIASPRRERPTDQTGQNPGLEKTENWLNSRTRKVHR